MKQRYMQLAVLLTVTILVATTAEEANRQWLYRARVHETSLLSKETPFTATGATAEDDDDRYSEWNYTCVIPWPSGTLTTYGVHHKGIIQVNFTVLPCSNASVNVTSVADGEWSPPLINNVTLGIGETFLENYTLVVGGSIDWLVGIDFTFNLFKESDNVTLYFAFKILSRGETAVFISAPGLLFTASLMGTFVLGTLILTRNRKTNKKP